MDVVRLRALKAVVFLLFFASGFCSLVYQVVWLRMAFAHFGIVTPVLSVVISTFMLGLGLGSLGAGKWGPGLARRFNLSPSVIYAVAEACVAIGAFAVPVVYDIGERMLLNLNSPSSAGYLIVSALVMVVALLPWCTMMGATFPLMMSFMRALEPDGSSKSFSYLYLGNVAGAMTGTLVSAVFLVELFGFRQTSWIAATINVLISVTAIAIGWRVRSAAVEQQEKPVVSSVSRNDGQRIALVLFTTGFCALAIEVVWIRGFTIILFTTIYAFALILAFYLFATWLGTVLYRRDAARGTVYDDKSILFWTAITAAIPVIVDDPRVQGVAAGVLLSIVPFCIALGYLTPKLMDDYSGGDAARAGRAYAVNIAGGIVGPLVAGYLLVTHFDVRVCLLLLAVPIAALAAWAWIKSGSNRAVMAIRVLVPVVPLLFGLFISQSYEGFVHSNGPREIRRDYVATAIAFGTGFDRGLLVNGVGITSLVPLTKNMAHLTLAVHGHAKKGLVICFGMGTTFRSLASWGIDSTVVDLSSSVEQLFGFFHSDAAQVAASPRSHIIADDGRRFLLRTDQTFDVIMIDPPPPTEAAGSSLLYSREFYDIVKRRLAPGGILQQWIPPTERATVEAVARTIKQSFPYVKVYGSIQHGWGYQFLCSESPIPSITPAEFVAHMPLKAQRDFIEWGPEKTALGNARDSLAHPIPMDTLVTGPGPIVTDDRPFNEYFILRRGFGQRSMIRS